MSSSTLCLNMIVKNESRTIQRLLDSVLPIIDTYCICDTGSTDNTMDIIREYFKDKGIPGRLLSEPFQNFSYNRNFSLQACRGLSDYILFLDADMILDIIKQFDKSMLKQYDFFYLLQGNDSFYYRNIRIVKNNGLYKYVGVTHEYIEFPKPSKSFSFNKKDLFIKDIGDGGAKHNKFQRDICLLKNGILEDPKNVRYHFYLANSYYHVKDYNEAIHMYKKRIELGGWKEEVWYSYYRIGICYKCMNRFPDALSYWLEGYDYYPERLEGIYEIIKHYRIIGKHKIGIKFYNLAKEILDKHLDRNQYLFLNANIYAYKIYLEYTILACYNNIININHEVIQVLNHSNVDDYRCLLSNMKFYKNILQHQSVYRFNHCMNRIIYDKNQCFTSSSSCMIPNPYSNGYVMNIRYVNYHIQPEGKYSLQDNNHMITINKWIELDDLFNKKVETWMELVLDGKLYMGVEDVRLYYDNYKQQLLYIGSGFPNHKRRVVSGEYNIKQRTLDVHEQTQTFHPSSCEKNWVFVDYNEETHIIYDWHPVRICKVVNHEIQVVVTKPTPKMFSQIRGSTCGFIYKTDKVHEIWFVNHMVSVESTRHYYHIISVFDSNMNLIRYSAPFKFEGDTVEYCLSIIVEDDRILMNYSTWNKTTNIGVYDKTYIDNVLIYTN
uniref:Glycosyltransferase 2-like domain-containing protein n=1 Tax=viral metagenome TaxID=1070528 RepID=A0A6C0JZN8_9ZZZZ